MPFRSCGATGIEGTCLWCGRKLRQKWTWDWNKAGHDVIKESRRKRYDKPGDYGDGFFCGLRCGYDFGVSMAGFGRRVVPGK